jgi:eukaryotic-like serine/threonine-protein kinase
MGTVYEAWDPSRSAPVALKLLNQTSAQGVCRLKREFRSLAELVHPNLVALDLVALDQLRARALGAARHRACAFDGRVR